MRIGIDFDNTIALYDLPMHRRAVQQGWIESSTPASKRLVRDAIRLQDDGESKWRGLQVFSYGEGIAEAQAAPGALSFLKTCAAHRLPVWVVSHKTEFPNFGSSTVNLRQVASDWLQANDFFEASSGLDPSRVYFEDTREAKIERIRRLRLTHFIDDLEETFLHRSFPRRTRQLLLSTHSPASPGAWTRCSSWGEIERHVFPG
ncbi:MAG: hypothetical protein JOZ39_01230 [Chloroflexi bacterium]|nr:hypothetical protein [Chloroflexota bacterium]